MSFDSFLKGYINCALWSSELDDYTEEFINRDTLLEMRKDCASFLTLADEEDIDDRWEDAGHDFWLTRNGHGAGFWDGDWPDEVGERLTKIAKSFGEFDLYECDGIIYS